MRDSFLPRCLSPPSPLQTHQLAIKCADISALSAARSVHSEWVDRLEEEFFRQGDREGVAGLPISPLMDRTKGGVSKAQPGVSERKTGWKFGFFKL